MKKEKGFTLVELLIVVAIIGILAAIAIPQFNKYKIRGYLAALRSDLKNAHTAGSSYLTDYPNGTIQSNDQLTRGGWKSSQNITFTAGNMTTTAGRVKLNSTNINQDSVEWGPAVTVTGVAFDGTIGSASADGEVAFDGTVRIPRTK